MAPHLRLRRGLTRIELLAWSVLLFLGIGMVLPVLQGPRCTLTRTSICANNLRQIRLGLEAYQATYGCLPPIFTVDSQGKPLHSWRTLILPYMDQQDLYRQIDLSKPWDDPVNAQALKEIPPAYHCPDLLGPREITGYLAIHAEPRAFHAARFNLRTDGEAHPDLPLLIIDAGENRAVPWMAPIDGGESCVLTVNSKVAWPHSRGMNILMGDGSVKLLEHSTPVEARRAMLAVGASQ